MGKIQRIRVIRLKSDDPKFRKRNKLYTISKMVKLIYEHGDRNKPVKWKMDHVLLYAETKPLPFLPLSIPLHSTQKPLPSLFSLKISICKIMWYRIVWG